MSKMTRQEKKQAKRERKANRVKYQEKKLGINMYAGHHRRKLQRYLDDGWEILHEVKSRQYLSGAETGHVDYILRREKIKK